MRRTVILAMSAAALLATTGCGSGGAAAAEDQGGSGPVVVAHVPSSLFAPLYVAEAKGYFEDEGVQVQLEPVAAGQDAVPLAASEQVDVIVAGFSAGFFSALDAELELQVVGSMAVGDGGTQDPVSSLQVATGLLDSGEVQTVADLAGRRIGITGGAGGASAYLTDLVLREAGLTLADVEVTSITIPDVPAALSSGSVDAAWAVAPFTRAVEGDGTARAFGFQPAGSSATGVVYSEQFAGTDQAQAFFTALVRAASDLQGDARSAPENLEPVAEATGIDVEVLAGLPLFTWREDLAPLPDQLEAMQQTWIDAGQLTYDEPIPAGEFTSASFSEAAADAVAQR